MTEKEKQALEYLEGMLTIYKDIPTPISQKALEIIVNLIEKQQKEIEELQILEDDLKLHRVAYIDEPEFEEKYISKDKIREKIRELEECRKRTITENGYTIFSCQITNLERLLEEDTNEKENN